VIKTLAHRVTVRTLDAVVERGRKSKRGTVRTAAGVLDRARSMVGLDGIPTVSPIPEFDGAPPDKPMWESDRKRFRKWQEAQGVEFDDGETSAEAEKPTEPEKPVKLYFKRGCPSTRAARGLLDEREIPYEAIDITDDEVQRSWVKLVTGRSTTPQVFVWGDPVGGFDDLRELDQSGELRKKIDAGTPDESAPAAATNENKGYKRIKLPILHPSQSPFEALSDDDWEGEADESEMLEGEDLLARVREVLDECRPMVQSDGGDIVLLDVTAKQVSIELTGNCVGCPSAQATLKQGIERRLKSRIPQIESISSPQLQ
jgi:Fe-S cluster biogenesis protein NfuA/glutaredoxin